MKSPPLFLTTHLLSVSPAEPTQTPTTEGAMVSRLSWPVSRSSGGRARIPHLLGGDQACHLPEKMKTTRCGFPKLLPPNFCLSLSSCAFGSSLG